VISSLASPESEMVPNDLILVAHGISGDLERLNELKVKLPKNMLLLDTATFERMMFNTGQRGVMMEHDNQPRIPGNTLSLGNTILSFGATIPCTLHNAGNDAFLCLLALQLLLQPEGVVIPKPNKTFSNKREPSHTSTVGAAVPFMTGQVGIANQAHSRAVIHPVTKSTPSPPTDGGVPQSPKQSRRDDSRITKDRRNLEARMGQIDLSGQ